MVLVIRLLIIRLLIIRLLVVLPRGGFLRTYKKVTKLQARIYLYVAWLLIGCMSIDTIKKLWQLALNIF